MSKRGKIFGPATLVTAAFVGPGTLTACTLAGLGFGHSLIWALVVATFIAILFQEMAGRVGLVRGIGLAQALRQDLRNPILKALTLILVSVAIIVGNAAYEAGNIAGAASGLEALTSVSIIWPPLIGLFAALILFIGNYKVIEFILIGLVVLMSAVFVITGILTACSTGWISGAGSESEMTWFTIVALIGTTVVPYNLFLHSSTVSKSYNGASDIPHMRRETWVSIGLGGIVSICILLTGAGAYGEDIEPNSVFDLAQPMANLIGDWSRIVWTVGFAAAGLTSAITAPLAAGLVANELFGKKDGMKSVSFRVVFLIILALGVFVSMAKISVIYIIQVAQVANGLILPFMAAVVLWIINRGEMKEHRNTLVYNVLGVVILLATLAFGFKSLNAVFEFV